jgi:phosphatidylserine/phosphatidylglycerophosphate/cardiolipin synthase-like enzyme
MSPSLASLVSGLDTAVGDGIEAAVRIKHRHRLDKLGWSRALEPPDDVMWAAGDPVPRPGCELAVLIDGAEAFPAIAAAIEQARESIYVTGWHVAPHFQLHRGDRQAALGVLLAEAAERLDVRVLVWAGAPVPAFHPTRGEVKEAVDKLTRETKIRCERDPREHPFHCHHEKTLIIDDEVAFVGGIDITDFGGDRFDSGGHPARRSLGWHDVGTRLKGPAVDDVRDHFAMRWREVTGDDLPDARPPGEVGQHTVQVVRTVSEVMYDHMPHGDFRILESYIRAIRSAREYIYLENQFLWSPEIVAELAVKLKDPPSDEFRIVIVLPSKANNGHDDTRGQLGVLITADDSRGDGDDRLLAATLRSRTGSHVDPLYVHAKVGIIDDRWLTVGSANLNAHSLLNDTEMNVVTDDPELARSTRLRLWAEHLELDVAAIADQPPARIVDEQWQRIAAEQLERQRAGATPTHRLLALPGVSRRSRRLLGPLQGLVDDG